MWPFRTDPRRVDSSTLTVDKTLIASRRSAGGLVALVAVALVAGCGGGGQKAVDNVTATSTAPAQAQTSPSQDDLGQKYLAIMNPVNAKADEFSKKANAWNDQTTNTQASNDAAPVIAAIDDASNKLLRVPWPASTATDVKELTRAMAAMSGDLGGLQTLSMLDASSWATQFSQDVSTAHTDANIVRADLGLPPAKP